MSNISQIQVNGVTYNIESTQVNEHTVDANVPANAKFTDTVYNDSGIVKSVNGVKPDSKGNVVVSTGSGNTSNGKTIIRNNRYAGLKNKKISFLGDSITTFNGWIPSGYEYYYPRYGVNDVEQTWWKQLVNKSGMELLVNGSWSGSRVTAVSGTASTKFGDTVARVNALSKNGIDPDIIVVMIGINDFGNGVACGDWDGSHIATDEDINTFSEAYALMVQRLCNKFQYAEIFLCTLPVVTGSYDQVSGFPANRSNGTLLQNYNEKIVLIAHSYGCKIIDMSSCGITYFNAPLFLGDGLHPNALGAKKLASKALADISAKSILNNDVDLPDEIAEDEVLDVWYNNATSTSTFDAVAGAQYAGFVYVNESGFIGKPINRFRMAVAQAGTMTYGKTNGSTYTKLGTITLSNPSKDVQIYKVDEFTLGANEHLVLSAPSDTGLFYYTRSNSTGAFKTRITSYSPALPSGTANENLSIDIGYKTPVEKWYVDVLKMSGKTHEAKPQYAGFAYSADTYAAFAGQPINAFRLAVHTTGDMEYGKQSGSTYTKLGTITLANPSKDAQIYMVDEFTLAAGERVVFGSKSDVGLFYYDDTATKIGTFSNNITASSAGSAVSSQNNLSIDIGYID